MQGAKGKSYEGSKAMVEGDKFRREIQKRERYLEVILESVPDGVITTDSQHRVVEWNKGAEQIFGYTKEEARGRDLDELVAPGSIRDEAKEYTQRVLSGNRLPPFECIRFRKDGTPVEVIASGAPVNVEGKLEGVVAVYRDISEQRAAERALALSEERYRSLFERLPVGLFVCTPEGRFLEANPALLKILGCPDLETLKAIDASSFYCSKRDRGHWRSIIEGRSHAADVECRMIRMDGKEIWVRERSWVVRGREGELISCEGVVEDITSLKAAEEEKSMLEQRLIQAQKMEAIGTLAGGIAHNFNNLLMAIQGHISLLRIQLDPDHPFQQRLEAVEELIESGAKLTDQLLGYAQKGQFEIMLLDINKIVTEITEAFALARKEILVELNLADDLKMVMGDKGQIEQMLLNLYVNAFEAMPKGGRISVSTRNVNESAMADRGYDPEPGSYVMIVVKDTGHGMDKEVMQRIFDPFFTTKEVGDGTGLGLSSVYGIVKNHKGYIDVFSEKGKGTSFEIFLPASSMESSPSVEEKIIGEEGPGGQGTTILLVDDEWVVLEVGKEMLESLGYAVFTARSGKEALQLYEQQREEIDLVILDLVLPEMGGAEIFDQLKQIDPNVKVLLSTGYGIVGEAGKLLNRGCEGFIQKPFRIDQLARKLDEILHRADGI